MEKLNAETFKTKVFNYQSRKEWQFEGKKPAIVDFYADWCAPCRALTPTLEAIARDYADKIDIYKVDTQAHPELAQLFDVRGIPALLFVPLEGKPAMSAGLMPREALDNAIQNVLKVERNAS